MNGSGLTGSGVRSVSTTMNLRDAPLTASLRREIVEPPGAAQLLP